MTSEDIPRDAEKGPELPDGAVPAQAQFAAHEGERFLDAALRGRTARLRFSSIVILVLLLHAAVIAAFLWRDQHDQTQVAQITETPVEIVQEPPEPQKQPPPPQPKKPEPPKPKEDLSPALSAPRAPNEEKVETQKTEPKTSAPKAPSPPSEGQPEPTAQAAPPKEDTPAPTKEDEASKEEDKSKPDAEALDKAKPKVAKEPKTKQVKAAPKHRQKVPDVLASLSGSSQLPDISFAKPTPKTRIFGGTDDVRWMSEVEAALESKVSQLPRTSHWQAGGHVVIFFHVDVSGRVIAKEIVQKSGYPDVDAIAMRALDAAAPFPPPPPGIEHGLVWSSVFDGQLPTLHIGKR